MPHIQITDTQQDLISLEYTWLGLGFHHFPNAPLIVFLHEGLGSVAMWKTFPHELCEAGGFCGLAYSRFGYGQSSPRPVDQAWQPQHLASQAEDLKQLLIALQIDTTKREVWLYGHSDGGSIALLYAAKNPETTAGIIIAAPHIMVEPICISAIQNAKIAYETTALKPKLAKFHADVDSAFYGWNGMWLNPAFTSWDMRDIRQCLGNIVCPILAIQGENDEYGTMAQIEGIKAALKHTELMKIPDCGHSPHRDASHAVIAKSVSWIKSFLAHQSTTG